MSSIETGNEVVGAEELVKRWINRATSRRETVLAGVCGPNPSVPVDSRFLKPAIYIQRGHPVCHQLSFLCYARGLE